MIDTDAGSSVASGDDMIEAICTMRSIRRYTDDEVPERDLAKMLYAATRAPSGSNRQNFRFLLLDDSPSGVNAREILATEFERRWRDKANSEGYRDRANAEPGSRTARMVRSMDQYAEGLAAAPVVILACVVRHDEPTPLEGSSIYPACQNLLLAARVLGYGGVLTQFHTGVEDELRSTLDIPGEVGLSGVITIGVPSGRHGAVRRRPMAETVFAGSWGRSAAIVEPDLGTDYPESLSERRRARKG